MRPDELEQLLTSMAVVADVVDALGDPPMQARRGWDLGRWSCHFVPWGVRFLHHDPQGTVAAAVVVLALPEARRSQFAQTWANASYPTALRMLG